MKQIFNRIFLVLTGIFLTLILVGCDQDTNAKKQFFTEENSEESSVELQSINLKEEVVEEQFSEATTEESSVKTVQISELWEKDTKIFSYEQIDDTQISQYTDENGTIIGYEIKMGENRVAYSLETSPYQFYEKEGEIPRIGLGEINTAFLYEKLLSAEEKEDMSTEVRLTEQVTLEEYEEYKSFLLWGGEPEFSTVEVYKFESDGANISLEQAMDLCADVMNNDGESTAKRVMEVDENGMFVGYSFNLRNIHREYGEDIDTVWIDNRIGVRENSIVNDGMMMKFIMYENHKSELDESYNHTALTIDYYVFLKDKIIVLEY